MLVVQCNLVKRLFLKSAAMKKNIHSAGQLASPGRAAGGSKAVDAIVRPLVTVDIAIFSIRDEALSVLLVQRGEGPDEPFPLRWALPGGFVDVQTDATIEACARRKLAAKTGVTAEAAGQATARQLIARLPAGEFYKAEGGAWVAK